MIEEHGILFKITDPLQKEIILKTETYNKKIANIDGSNDDKQHGNSHPEISIGSIKENVTYPHLITHAIEQKLVNGKEEKVISDKRNRYIRIAYNEENDKLYAQSTIVEFKDGNSYGEVVTSFRVNKLSKILAEGGVIYDATKQNI